MIVRLAIRTLFAHPVRSGVLAAGFGVGVAVMAILLGVAEVVLDQARSPGLVGGGDVLISGVDGRVSSARLLLTGTLRTPPLAGRLRAASPWTRETLYLVGANGDTTEVRVRAGIPSLERAVGDPETSGEPAWTDSPRDTAWVSPDPAAMLRLIDGFHPIPDVPARAHSWAEWLYFNGRSSRARFYLTFLVGPADANGQRTGGVRLQLDRGQGLESFSAAADLRPEMVAAAPELTIAGNHIRLRGMEYRVTLNLQDRSKRTLTGELVIEAAPGRLMPPLEIHGAAGWRSGYVVPVMSGRLDGALVVDGQRLTFDDGVGYHDHNWGFWEGVSWQWGQVQHGDLSIVYGRIFPPADAADADRIPGFLALIGPDGPVGYATNVLIDEENAAETSQPSVITVTARSISLDLTARFSVETIASNRIPGPLASTMDFLQMRGLYRVEGKAADRALAFEAQGSAETFRGR